MLAAAMLVVFAMLHPASADQVIEPADGAIVGSRPTFAFTVTNGAVDLELSRSPDVKIAGDDVGAFVDVARSDYQLLYRREPQDGRAPWAGRPLTAGEWFWHARLRDDSLGGDAAFGAWLPARRMIVEREPPVLEGWTLRGERLRGRRGCRVRVRVSGKVSWFDNDARPRMLVSLTFSREGWGGWSRDVRLDVTGRYAVVVCGLPRVVDAEIELTDASGDTATAPPRRFARP